MSEAKMNVGSEAEWSTGWRQVIDTARRTVADGLVVGTSGNVSLRVADAVLITPSGVPYDRLGPEDLCAVDLTGRQLAGDLRPSSELPLHLAVHQATGSRAVVHTHALHATAASTLVEEVPPVHYVTAMFGGPVRVAPYARYGSRELAEGAVAALDGRTACLLRNHGTLAYGEDLDQAFDRTAQLEWMCRLWLTAHAVPGLRPSLLSPAELAEAGEALRDYGPRTASPGSS